MPRELLGQAIDLPSLRNAPPPTPDYDRLPKRCRRLLEYACTHGRVEPKDGDSHFLSLVNQRLLTPDGQPTDSGRECWRGQLETPA